jgi:hypothetical protein
MVWMILLLTIAAQASWAGPTRFTSTYTDLRIDCRPLDNTKGEAAGQDAQLECKGFGGYKISVSYSAVATALAIESKVGGFYRPLEAHKSCMQKYGDKIEWRLANGQPFAVIVRVACLRTDAVSSQPGGDGTKIAEYLIIRGLKNYGCIDIDMEISKLRSPNTKARSTADQLYFKRL